MFLSDIQNDYSPIKDTSKQTFNTNPSADKQNTQFQSNFLSFISLSFSNAFLADQENPVEDSADLSIRTTTMMNQKLFPAAGSRNWQSNQGQLTGEQRKTPGVFLNNN